MKSPLSARTPRAFFTILALPLTSLALHAGNIAHDESVNGDLSTDSSSPTDLTFQVGDNEVHGTTGRVVAGGPVDRDFFRISIPAGQQLSAIEMLAGTTFAGPGGLSFLGVVNASDFGLTPPAAAGALLGYHHTAASEIGTDILDDLGAGAGAIGFTGPLGPGTYAFWVQETAVSSVAYGYNFKMTSASPVPDAGPAGWLSFATLGLTLVGGRRWARS